MVGATADRQIRLFDIRAGQITASVEGHQGAKPPRVAWLGNSSRFVSSGFTKGSSRQLKFWDSRNLGGGELGQLDLGTGSGVFNLMFDEDTNVLFLNPKVWRPKVCAVTVLANKIAGRRHRLLLRDRG